MTSDIASKATPGPCAKRRVVCIIRARDGSVVAGANDCLEPQNACPRLPGEGYEKCETVCFQPGHAEVMAVREARRLGVDLRGARATLIGINWICQHCRQITEAVGIERIYVENTHAAA